MRPNPLVYEINTWVWLTDLSERFGRTITLGSVPSGVFDELASWHPDAIWLMGVWERSPRGREIALKHPDLQFSYTQALPDFKLEDVVASPYAVHRYVVDAHLGGPDELAAFRAQLRRRNIDLILDYVPNHVAVDHHWTLDCPNCLVQGSENDLAARSTFYFRVPENNLIFAHGRDPYYPAWTDTAQVNAFSQGGREQSLATVQAIAEQCDGIRCDMAMLLVNRVFGDLWAKGVEPPATEYWQDIIPVVKKKRPDFVFMAEVYWQMEAELQSLGFDYTYDKRLYDRLRNDSVHTIRDHLLAASSYQRRMVRFIENHDEERAVYAFGLEKSQAAAVMVMTLPGAKLIHEGQLEGRKIKLPVQLGKRLPEQPLEPLREFYKQLMDQVSKAPYHDGTFMMLAAHPILGDDHGHENLFAYAWALNELWRPVAVSVPSYAPTISGIRKDWRIVVINYSDLPSKGRIMLPRPDFAGPIPWKFYDALQPGEPIIHVGDDLLTSGLVVDLGAWGAQLLTVEKG